MSSRKELTAEARELKGELYCLPCHDKMGVPICGACRRPIEGRVVNALGKRWHVEVSRPQPVASGLGCPGSQAPGVHAPAQAMYWFPERTLFWVWPLLALARDSSPSMGAWELAHGPWLAATPSFPLAPGGS